ncbi:unnamed protein product [Caenorhabditis nigoni]
MLMSDHWDKILAHKHFSNPQSTLKLTGYDGIGHENLENLNSKQIQMNNVKDEQGFNFLVKPGQKAFQVLTEYQMHALAEKLRNLQILIIDEISLVTGLLLVQIEHRLREIFGSDQPFGGVCIVVFWGFTPTAGRVHVEGGREGWRCREIAASVPKIYEALYATITPRRPEFKNLWRRFEMDELTENVRTSCPLEQRVLEEVRMGKQSEKTMEFLISRCEMVGKKPEDLHRELRSLRNEDPEGEYVIQAFKNSRIDEINSWIEPLTEYPSCTRYVRNGLKKKILVIVGRVVITDNHGLEDPSLANGVSGVLLEKKACGSSTAEAMSVHKGQWSTYNGSVIDSDGMANEAMFYTALNRSQEQTRIVWAIRYRGSESAHLELEMIQVSTERKRGGQ